MEKDFDQSTIGGRYAVADMSQFMRSLYTGKKMNKETKQDIVYRAIRELTAATKFELMVHIDKRFRVVITPSYMSLIVGILKKKGRIWYYKGFEGIYTASKEYKVEEVMRTSPKSIKKYELSVRKKNGFIGQNIILERDEPQPAHNGEVIWGEQPENSLASATAESEL